MLVTEEKLSLGLLAVNFFSDFLRYLLRRVEGRQLLHAEWNGEI